MTNEEMLALLPKSGTVIKVTKINLFNHSQPSGIEPGESFTGPCSWLEWHDPNEFGLVIPGVMATSPIRNVEGDTFRTKTSTYKFEVLDFDKEVRNMNKCL